VIPRREFISLIGGAAVVWPVEARAQQAMPVIGFLGIGSAGTDTDYIGAFRQGLREAGYVEGSNVAVEYRWAQNENARLPALAADLVRRRVAVIATPGSTPATLAAKAATPTIPIVFGIGSDPVESGLVASLNRPGGNVTGVAFLSTAILGKRVELLRELVPTATIMALLVNPANPTVVETYTKEVKAAAQTLGLQVHVLNASTERDLDAAFETCAQLRAGALIVGADVFFTTRRNQIVALAARHALPTIYGQREFALAGGLMSYSTSLPDAIRQVGIYVGRILSGDKPADLPVQQSTKVELVINLKTAQAHGLTFPITLLGRADEVIE
jgi:putative ABC transport system substrate-binding protein